MIVVMRPRANQEPIDLREAIRDKALQLGFSCAGFTSADPLGPTQQRRWERWRELGVAGAMRYLARERPRRTHPRDLMPEARTALVVAAGYYDGDHPAATTGEMPGKVARYAWGRDYHDVLRERLTRLGEWIQAEAARRSIDQRVTFRPCVDSAPLDERSLAVRAGLGFIGKNTLLLDPERGSWSMLAVLLISLELPPDEAAKNPAATCGRCRRCLEACPTGALVEPYRMDPRLCISYLTIENPGEIPDQLAVKMRGWAFGCDLCQEVCPFNARPMDRIFPGLAASEGIGPVVTRELVDSTPSGKAFQRRFGHTPLARPGLRGMRRNLDACGCRKQTE